VFHGRAAYRRDLFLGATGEIDACDLSIERRVSIVVAGHGEDSDPNDTFLVWM
jgi:hypothetical protein